MLINKLHEVAKVHPDLVCLYSADKTVTYSQLVDLSSRVAKKFEHLPRGAKVGVAFADTVDSVVIRHGLAQLGVTYVQLMAKLPTAELQRRCDVAECKFILADAPYEILSNFEHEVISDVEEYVAGVQPLDEIRAEPHDDLCICWSSGTGGKADGLVHSHYSMFHVVKRLIEVNQLTETKSVIYSVIPLGTTAGIMYLYHAMYAAITTVIESRAFTPLVVLNNLKDYKVTHLAASPAVYSILLRRQTISKDILPFFCESAGDTCSIKLQQEWQQTYGQHLHNILGSSQNGASLGRQPDAPWGAMELLGVDMQIELRDENGTVVADGEPGEIWFKSPSNIVREITDGLPSLVDGWVTTHDVLLKDKDGYYYMQGRSKDTFKADGRFVSPVKVEETVRELAEVDEAVAVKGFDDNGLSCVKVYVVPTEGTDASLLPHKVRVHAGKLQSHERPKLVEVIEELPRHPASMKVQRSRLRA